MTSTVRRLTVDAVIKMATAAANKHLDIPASVYRMSPGMAQAIAASR